MKIGDTYRLACGHDGRVVYINDDETAFWVQGTRRGCSTCGKGRSSAWKPTTYLMG